MAATALNTARSSRAFEARVQVTTPGGTYIIAPAMLQPGSLKNLLLRGVNAPVLPPFHVELIKAAPLGTAIAQPVFTTSIVGTEAQLAFTWDDPGVNPETWLLRVEHIHSAVR